MKTIIITQKMLELKLDNAKYEVARARKNSSAQRFYIAEVARVAAMLAGVA